MPALETSAKSGPAVTKPSGSPRILYFSVPWPNQAVRSVHIARALRQMGRVDIVLVDADCAGDKVERPGSEYQVVEELSVHPRPVRGFSQKLKATLDPTCPYPHGMGVDEAANRRILARIQDYDLIWFLKFRMANMFNNWQWPHSVLDVDDLPSGVYRTEWQTGQTLKRRLVAGLQILAWKRREQALSERFTVVGVCSQGDKALLNLPGPVHVIPNGYARSKDEPQPRPATPPRIGFIGLFDYFANVEGVRWFVEQCWALIKRELPDARLRLAGRGSDELFKSAGPDVDALGWVDSAADEIATWSAMIVPIQVGGGTRVKIAEGFSRKCPIVSTRVGAYGYDVQHGRELMFADKPADFAAACVAVIRDPAGSKAMAERAYQAFLEKWTWEAITPKVWAAAEDCLRRSPARK
jgi:glycosyltransferase involved in cell wall biosynthesis